MLFVRHAGDRGKAAGAVLLSAREQLGMSPNLQHPYCLKERHQPELESSSSNLWPIFAEWSHKLNKAANRGIT